MERVRSRHPGHIPCRFKLPDKKEFKLLLPSHANAGWAMQAVRSRMPPGCASTGYFLFCGGKMCTGATPLQRLDTNAPQEVMFVIMRENTFG